MQITSRPTIANVAMTTGGTEYSYAIPSNVKRIKFKLRALNALLKYTFVATESNTTYITVPYGESEIINDARLGGRTIYFQSPTSTQVLEIKVWV